MLKSVPVELSTDHMSVLTVAGDTAHVNVSGVNKALGWDSIRTQQALV